METRKEKEIEHSRKRREVLRGFERLADTHAGSQVSNLEELIKNESEFAYHFSNMKYYAVTESSEKYKWEWIRDKCREGTKVLDFACGNGENGIYAAQSGAHTLGIDISPEGIDNAIVNARKLGVADQCTFLVMDGEAMSFADNEFDVAIEYGALHHVDLETALGELRRVLKLSGEMICVEALRHNPIIHWYRKRTPQLRTDWEVEHILGVESIQTMKKYFREVNVKYFHLFSLILVPLRKTFIFKFLLPLFDLLDSWILSSTLIGKYGWIMVVTLKSPIK